VFSHLRMGRMRNKHHDCSDIQLELVDQRTFVARRSNRPCDSLRECETDLRRAQIDSNGLPIAGSERTQALWRNRFGAASGIGVGAATSGPISRASMRSRLHRPFAGSGNRCSAALGRRRGVSRGSARLGGSGQCAEACGLPGACPWARVTACGPKPGGDSTAATAG
jgi:hypothetical protein